MRTNGEAIGSWFRHERSTLSHVLSFWVLAALLAFFLFAASAPSPLYGVYAAKYHFSPITLTAVYAVYAAGALGALLTAGRLSDHFGRRPVVMTALAIQIASMLAFITATGVGSLYVGRVLQGVATGVATGAISAWLLDLEPSTRPRLGSLVAGIALLAGLAAGALSSSLLIQYAPDPLHLVFWFLACIYVLGFAAVIVTPDHTERSPGWARSMVPEIGVSQAARSLFLASAPSLIAIWALGGLYLSLGPSLALSLVHTTSPVAGGIVIALLTGTGALASVAGRTLAPRATVIGGLSLLISGVGITLLGVFIGSAAALYAGTFVAGVGFGPSFSGIFRGLAPLAPPQRRGALMASIYIVVYSSFSVPAILAGIAVVHYGLSATTYVFGLVVMALAAMTTLALSRGER